MDFTKEWTDEELVKEWGLEDMWDYIDSFIPEFYTNKRLRKPKK